MTIIRLLALVPVSVALLIAWGPVYDAGYRELVLPNDLVTPLPIRVLRDVPGQVLGILGAWLVSDAAAAIAVRRLVLERRSPAVAWLLGWLGLVRHPLRALVASVVGLGTMILLIGPALLASAAGWTRVRDVMLLGADPWAVLVVVAVWVATWLATLVLAGIAAAVRAAAWTFAVDPGRHREVTGHV
jgi:hypothetical protein